LQALIAKSDITTVSRHLTEALGDCEYKYVKLPKAARGKHTINEFKATLSCNDKKQLAAAKKGAATGLAINNGKTLAKNLGNMPGNVCTPTFLANQAKKMTKTHDLKVKVLNEKEMSTLGMGSLLSVRTKKKHPTPWLEKV